MMNTPFQFLSEAVRRFERRIGPRQMQFLIDCSDLPGILLPLEKLMHSQRALPCRPMVVGLRIKKTRLQVEDIEALASVLPSFQGTASAITLDRLDIMYVQLSPPSLQALARLLDQHPVQQLRLDNVLERVVQDETVVGLQGVLHSVFSPTVAGIRTPICLALVSISLDARCVDALAIEVEAGTRRLAALTVVNSIWLVDAATREERWASLARVAYTGRHQLYSCEVNLGGNLLTMQDVASFNRVHAELVSNRLAAIQSALADGVPVSCRIKKTSANTLAVTPLDTAIEFLITAVDPVQGRLCVRTSADESVWLDAQSIDSLHCKRPECALFFRFDSILFHAGAGHQANGELAMWLATVGRNIRRLSIPWTQDVRVTLPQLPLWCPRLTHLDIKGGMLPNAQLLWNVLRAYHATMVSINAAATSLTADAVEQLVALQRELIPGLALRHLSLKCSSLGDSGLCHVATLLRESSTLEVIELFRNFRGADADETEQHITACHDGKLIRAVPPPMDAQLAFVQAASVATRSGKALDESLLSLIFEFVAHGIKRAIIW